MRDLLRVSRVGVYAFQRCRRSSGDYRRLVGSEAGKRAEWTLRPVVGGFQVDQSGDSRRVFRGKGGQLVAGERVADQNRFLDAYRVHESRQVSHAGFGGVIARRALVGIAAAAPRQSVNRVNAR